MNTSAGYNLIDNVKGHKYEDRILKTDIGRKFKKTHEYSLLLLFLLLLLLLRQDQEPRVIILRNQFCLWNHEILEVTDATGLRLCQAELRFSSSACAYSKETLCPVVKNIFLACQKL